MKHSDLRQRIGRLLFVGVPGPVLDGATRRTLETLHVGGVVLFRRNAGSAQAIAQLTSALHALPSQPLVAIDHEGGRVMRVGEPFTQFPAAAVVGRTGNAMRAYDVGHAMALELASVGIDLSFAPVLDVHSNPANPVIGDRAYGADPALVADMGVAMMRGLHDGGIIACGKHFPGHGDTEADSHFELPIVRRSRQELERTELVPFRAAVAAGIPMLMTAHILYPALDPHVPATVSRTILSDVLRGELGFGGVVISDDLAMRAITAQQAPAEAAVASLRAGADAVLVCQELDHAVEACAAIEAAVADGRLSKAAITGASRRVAELHSALPARSPHTCELPNAAHRALAETIRLG